MSSKFVKWLTALTMILLVSRNVEVLKKNKQLLVLSTGDNEASSFAVNLTVAANQSEVHDPSPNLPMHLPPDITAQLQSRVHFQATAIGVEFHANLTISTVEGSICVEFHTEGNQCPLPYIRTRLIGSSLVHIPIARTTSATQQQRLSGCATIPIPGLYFLDALLVHCTMDVENETIPVEILMKQCPVRQDNRTTNNSFVPFNFTLPPFEPSRRLKSIPTRRENHSSWIYAPPCPNSQFYKISDQCTHAATPPKFLPTKYQQPEWLHRNGYTDWDTDEGLITRWDAYVWLPVDWVTGAVDYDAHHATALYTPPPPHLEKFRAQQNSTLRTLFLGDSHIRYLKHQVAQIFSNNTEGKDGCMENDDSNTDPSPFDYEGITLAKYWRKARARDPTRTFDHDRFVFLMVCGIMIGLCF